MINANGNLFNVARHCHKQFEVLNTLHITKSSTIIRECDLRKSYTRIHIYIYIHSNQILVCTYYGVWGSTRPQVGGAIGTRHYGATRRSDG